MGREKNWSFRRRIHLKRREPTARPIRGWWKEVMEVEKWSFLNLKCGVCSAALTKDTSSRFLALFFGLCAAVGKNLISSHPKFQLLSLSGAGYLGTAWATNLREKLDAPLSWASVGESQGEDDWYGISGTGWMKREFFYYRILSLTLTTLMMSSVMPAPEERRVLYT